MLLTALVLALSAPAEAAAAGPPLGVAGSVQSTVPKATQAPSSGPVSSPVSQAAKKTSSIASVPDAAKSAPPVQKAVQPVKQTVQPVKQAVQKTVAPVQKAVAPVQKAVAPVQQAVAPVQKAVAPVQQAVAPVQKAVAPVQTVVEPVLKTATDLVSQTPSPQGVTKTVQDVVSQAAPVAPPPPVANAINDVTTKALGTLEPAVGDLTRKADQLVGAAPTESMKTLEKTASVVLDQVVPAVIAPIEPLASALPVRAVVQPQYPQGTDTTTTAGPPQRSDASPVTAGTGSAGGPPSAGGGQTGGFSPGGPTGPSTPGAAAIASARLAASPVALGNNSPPTGGSGHPGGASALQQGAGASRSIDSPARAQRLPVPAVPDPAQTPLLFGTGSVPGSTALWLAAALALLAASIRTSFGFTRRRSAGLQLAPSFSSPIERPG